MQVKNSSPGCLNLQQLEKSFFPYELSNHSCRVLYFQEAQLENPLLYGNWRGKVREFILPQVSNSQLSNLSALQRDRKAMLNSRATSLTLLG